MDKSNINTLITGTVPVAVLALAMAFYNSNDDSESAQASVSGVDRSAVIDIVQEQLAQAGLTGNALDETMEDAIITFIKSRAAEPGTNSGAPKPTPPPVNDNVDIDPIDLDSEPVAGNENARYQLIVYSDYDCPYCQRFSPTLENVIDNYGQDLAVTLRDLPLSFHGESAVNKAVAAQCAYELGGNDAFWAFSNGLFDRPDSKGKDFSGLVAEVGLEHSAFQNCLDNDDGIRSGIDADIASAQKAGIQGTPTSVLLDTKTGSSALIRGAQPLSAIASSLDNLLGNS